MNKKGVLVVFSGFAGSGKGTIMKELLKRYDNYAFSVSATTRSPRPGEQNGVDYFYITTEEFEKMIEEDALLEYARYVTNYYGTPRKYVEDQLNAGKDVILEIETQGALQIKEKYPDALLIFVMPPSVEEIHNRLVKRGTETEEVIMQRMTRGGEEAKVISKYDYVIINDDLEKCIETVHATVGCSHYAVSRNMDIIDRTQQEFTKFLGGK